ncbi:hypothetical protein [Paenibacillus sp. JJ-223]|uniref:hypothetical protein n=1 Tax=Paenibacillus sp. JJ-223 TaxID=2905647 RepID=UPI001F482C5D|nr:hypothetical protein [Paenibacillus sp. JJ-223]CAH1223027.1 hypothetical protein PAECIP111890_05470 [Paenibacillus sp. JJ-223]
MILKIIVYGMHSFYYHVPKQYAEYIPDWISEFHSFLNTLEYKHQFSEYTEMVEEDGSISFAGFVRVYGAEDFVDWANVEKINQRGLYSIEAPPNDEHVDWTFHF